MAGGCGSDRYACLILLAGVVGWRASRALRTATEEVRSEGRDSLYRPAPSRSRRNKTSNQSAHRRYSSRPPASSATSTSQARPGSRNITPAGHCSSTTLSDKSCRRLRWWPWLRRCLADSRETELVIATAQDGLLAFNGRAFRQIFPQDASARTITSVLPAASGHLLIGTRKRGVLLYDGKKITVLHPTLSNLYVTTLAGTESDLWVGTLNQGVLHWHAGAGRLIRRRAGTARSPGTVNRSLRRHNIRRHRARRRGV